jgi:hypothetical protein
MEDVFDGFLRNRLLVNVSFTPRFQQALMANFIQAYRHVFLGPSAAVNDGNMNASRRAGNAAKHGIRRANLVSISYVATLVRPCLINTAGS